MRANDLREHNTAAIARAVVRGHGSVSRADIAASARLTRSTVSTIVDELMTAGLIIEGEPVASRGGRPRVPLTMTDRVVGLGAEIAADQVRVVARSAAGTVMAVHSAFADISTAPPATTLDLLASTIDAIRSDLPATTDVCGLTVSVPGRLSRDGRVVVSAPNLRWIDVPIADLMHAHPQLDQLQPVAANDSDLAARFEVISRPGESFLFIHGETGVGGSIVLDGQILRGDHGWAGEIGHVNVVPGGDICGCGRRGCLEAYAGFHALRHALSLPEGIHIDDLASALAVDSPAQHEILERVGGYLGVVLAGVLNTLDLSTVVLSGYFRTLAPQLEPSVRAVLEERALRPDAELVEAQGTGRHEADGAARESLERFWNDITGWMSAHRIEDHVLAQ